VRAERAGDAVDHAAARVAAGGVFEFEQREVVDARKAQRTRGGKAGDAAAGDDHARALHGRRAPGCERAVAHRMAARDVDAGEAAFDGRGRRLAARPAPAAPTPHRRPPRHGASLHPPFGEHRGTGFAGPPVLPPAGLGEATRSARSLGASHVSAP
jgi:hypothetical protein